MQSSLAVNPIWTPGSDQPAQAEVTVMDKGDSEGTDTDYLKIGLGIDAGGTYTDTVIYDFERDQTISKSKALTTRWDFTVGIKNALAKLDHEKLQKVEMVSLSTTLATNAIVEGEGQKVGMIIMPPYGRFEPEDIPYEPKAIISGQLEITGREICPVDKEQVKQVVRRMVAKDGVKAFAENRAVRHLRP